MHSQPVPDQVDRPPALAPGLGGERGKGFGWSRSGSAGGRSKAPPPAARRYTEGGDHGDFLPGSGPLVEDRSLADRGPGSTEVRGHQKPALVEEDEAGLQPPGVFFTLGQSVLTQPRIA